MAVTRGLADKWICARGRRRVKSPALPPRQTAEECQADLDEYAKTRGWQPVGAVAETAMAGANA